MNRNKKLLTLAGVVLLVFSSITIAEQVATSFIYPVGNRNSPPTEQAGNANGFVITQNFNTDFVYRGTSSNPISPNGGWCNNTTSTIYTDQIGCTIAGFKWKYGHTGVDLANSGTCNTAPIVATANGVVELSGWVDGYGNLLKIKHTLPNGRIIHSLYGHRSSAMMSVGQVVTKGQTVGYVGDTGAVGHCHLHFAIYDDAMKFPSGVITPAGYFYNDKGTTLSIANSIRYFSDPLLFVSDSNNGWQIALPGANYWSVNFSSTQSVTTRTMYVVNGAGVAKSLQAAVDAGWMNSVVYWWNGSTWVRYANPWPIESYMIPAGVRYAFGMLRSDLTLHWFVPCNGYLDARWRGDMAAFTTVNASLGFGRALRETYGKNLTWSPLYVLVSMRYEQVISGVTHTAIVYLCYSTSNPLKRFVCYYNPQTGAFSSWVQVF